MASLGDEKNFQTFWPMVFFGMRLLTSGLSIFFS
jgi:hypothetical protein